MQPIGHLTDQLATIAPLENSWGDHLLYKSIDGQSPTIMSAADIWAYSGAVKLAPGNHSLAIKVVLGMTEDLALIYFDVRPGKTYYIRHTFESNKYILWCEDDAENKIATVSGQTTEIEIPTPLAIPVYK